MRGVLSSAGFPAVAGRLPGVAPGSPAARQRSSARDIPRFKLQRRSFGSQVGWLRGRKAEAAALRPEADQRWAALEEAEKLRGLRGYENNLAGMTIDYSDDLEDRLTSTLEQKPPAGGFQFSDDPSKVFRRTRTELITEVWQDIKELALLSLSSDAVPTRDGYEGLERLKYKMRRVIWTSVTGQYLLVLAIVAFLAFCGGLFYSSVTGEDLAESVWQAQLFVLDSGTVAEVKSFPGRVIGWFLTIVGLLLVSVLVGIVSQTIERQVASVTSQISQVMETDHILILNWNSSAPQLVKELMLGNSDMEGYARNHTIVVMAEADQQVMNMACKEVLPRNGKGDVLCVRGNPNMSSSLEMVCACRARAIIILADKDRDTSLSSEECDANAVCTMLALASAASVADVTLPRVIMEVHAADTLGLVRRTFGNTVYPILVGAFAAKMTVQTILMPGISRVFKDLLTFQGSEFYFLPVPPAMVGIPYGRLSALIQEAIPVGLQHASGLELMPKEHCLIKEDDSIILLQPSSKSTDLKGAARFQELNVSLESMSGIDEASGDLDSRSGSIPPASTRHVGRVMTALFSSLDNDLTRGHGGLVEEFGGSPLLKGVVLICGWRPGIGMVLKTLDIIMGFGSEVHVLADIPASERDAFLAIDGLDLDYIRNIKLIHFQGKPGIVQDLQQLPMTNYGYTAVVLLANWTSDARSMSISTADAVRMKSVLQVRDFLWNRTRDSRTRKGLSTYFVTEVSGTGSDVSVPISEFVEVGQLDVLAISQMVFQPALHRLQMELLDTGVHLSLEPVGICSRPGEILSFKDMSKRIHANTSGSSLLIGYKEDGKVYLNPPSRALVMWEEHHELVLLNRVRVRKTDKVREQQLENKLRRRRARLQKALGSPPAHRQDPTGPGFHVENSHGIWER